MDKHRFIFFTKTSWDEPPRIRHQLAQMLAGAGHDILFFEKPRPLWRRSPRPRQVDGQISILSHGELLHHQLRMTWWLHQANEVATKASIRRALSSHEVDDTDIVINFNYEYYFLRDLFPGLRIITIINDDFISPALFGKVARRSLRDTCVASDRVLTVSKPLQEQLRDFCYPELFLPWADQAYSVPKRNKHRNILLFWGYINRRIDFGFLHELADNLLRRKSDLRILMVGPIQSSGRRDLSSLSSRSNVTVLSPTSLGKLPLDEVLAAVLPYRAAVPAIDAITLPNKAMQLLARGIPLLITGMPHFVEAPFVLRADRDARVLEEEYLRSVFDELQPAIEEFVGRNGAEARVTQLLYR